MDNQSNRYEGDFEFCRESYHSKVREKVNIVNLLKINYRLLIIKKASSNTRTDDKTIIYMKKLGRQENLSYIKIKCL